MPMISTLLPLFCINFIWLQQVFPTYSIQWIVAYPVDNAIPRYPSFEQLGPDVFLSSPAYLP